jgi:hypothetical protein
MTLTLAGVVVLYILSAPVVEHHAMGGASFSKRPQWLHRYMQPWDWLTRVPLLSGPLQSYQSWYSVRKYEMPPVVEESPGVGAGR